MTSLTSQPSHLTTQEDTICALATAPGGALGVIRISGSNAISITGATCRSISATTPANTVHYTHITDSDGSVIDEAMVSIFRAPHSYTGEDSVEISCHGSPYILNKALEVLVKNGCRMANPGEFTMRAYLNGKLDLSQAEAVADLIASTNRATHRIALSQLRGQFSSELDKLRDQLLQMTTLLELELDFSDHEDLEFADRTQLMQLAQTIEKHVDQLAHTFETGQAVKQGIPVAIVGKTNVGKSTLLNRLLKDDRAIVSDIHGTTRDTIEDNIEINGVNFRFIDTAGIRETSDKIEQIGIDRTYQTIDRARIVIWMIDQWPSEEEIGEMIKRCENKKLIPLWNKSDKEGPAFPIVAQLPVFSISAKKGWNIEKLEQAIYTAADIPHLHQTDVIVTSVRHYHELLYVKESMREVSDAITSGLSADLIAESLKSALDHLAAISGKGRITPQETLNNIFSSFCVGK